MLLLPSRRKNKPPLGARLNPSHPLAPDHAWVGLERAGNTAFGMSATGAPINGAYNAAATWGPNGYLFSTSTDNYITLASDPITGLAAVTVAAKIRWNNSGTSKGLIGSFTDGSNAGLLIFTTGSDFLDFRIYANIQVDVTSSTTVQNGVPRSMLACWKASVGNDARLFIDGREEGTPASTGGTIGTGTPPACRIGNYLGAGQTPVGEIDYIYLWRSKWLPDIAPLIHSDPYQVFETTTPRLWFDMVSAAPPGGGMGIPFGNESTAFAGGKTWMGLLR